MAEKVIAKHEQSFTNKTVYTFSAYTLSDPPIRVFYRKNTIKDGLIYAQVTETKYSVTIRFFLKQVSTNASNADYYYYSGSFSMVDTMYCEADVTYTLATQGSGTTHTEHRIYREQLGSRAEQRTDLIGSYQIPKVKKSKTVSLQNIKFRLYGARIDGATSKDDEEYVLLGTIPNFTVIVPPTVEQARVKANGEWKTANIMIKNNGEWKDVIEGFVKVDGTWKEMV